MKDLTVGQTAKQLRRLFPGKSCKAECGCWSYSHETYGNEKTMKSIYVEGATSINKEGESFRGLLEKAKDYAKGEVKP